MLQKNMLTLPSTIQAAILMVTRKILRELGLSRLPDTAEEICSAVGCGTSQVFALLPRVWDTLAGILNAAGRPKAPEPSPEDVLNIWEAMREFLIDNPGCIEGRGQRRIYSDVFRRFVLELLQEEKPSARMTLEQLAQIVGVPLGTLKNWTRSPGVTKADGPSHSNASEELTSDDGKLPKLEIADPRIAIVLREYPAWKGTFGGFCQHLLKNHRIPFRDTFISSLLDAAGLRSRKPRKKARVPWSKGTFRTFFPGAQWIGDGKTVAIRWNGRYYVFNIEAIVDAHSNAVAGAKLTDVENEEAVIEAFNNGVETTGEPPLIFSLDNRSCNHTERVEAAVTPAQLLASTLGRGPAKAPVEGTFGLFSQTSPPWDVQGTTERELARVVAELLFLTWAWARNHKPRKKLGGRTPAQIYKDANPSPEDIAAIKAWAAELNRREKKRRQTRERRADPVRLQILRSNLTALGISDPKGRLAVWLAGYSIDAILVGLATFRAKLENDTIPADADHERYLGGIIKNLNDRDELERIGEYLLELRLQHRELSLAPLIKEADRIRSEASEWSLPQRFIDNALKAIPLVDFRFWLKQAQDAMAPLSEGVANALYTPLVRRIAASFGTKKQWRSDLIAALASVVAATPEHNQRPAQAAPSGPDPPS